MDLGLGLGLVPLIMSTDLWSLANKLSVYVYVMCAYVYVFVYVHVPVHFRCVT